ncbi:MAG: 2-C-methyl-D-erythritol 4-phosphate cytidylyltransferase [Verrucomicrobia bacterium]|nr:2-C-methyl-D-erythritol 4-phosphate cytidylyltransferase [Verrucomicrobiota bacterium]
MIAILVAAGNSRRMGFDKLMADLAGKPVAAHSLLAFETCPSVKRIVLVTREERVAEFTELCRNFGITKLQSVVPGGAERHLSVWNGMQAAQLKEDDYVAVHDAARPLITPSAILACFAKARHHGASSCAAPVTDTLKRATADGVVTGNVERDHIWAMQTPQIFLAELLERAYRQILRLNETVTDEVSAVHRLGVSVVLTRIDEPNLKITHPRDLDLARLILESRKPQ